MADSPQRVASRSPRRHACREGEGVAFEVDHLAPGGIELGVDKLPCGRAGVPVFRHPVILEPPGAEVRAEPATGAGRHPGGPKKRDGEPTEGMAARADTVARRARLVERPRVHGTCDGE